MTFSSAQVMRSFQSSIIYSIVYGVNIFKTLRLRDRWSEIDIITARIILWVYSRDKTSMERSFEFRLLRRAGPPRT